MFFFFDTLYEDSTIRKAFQMICADKMLSDGYFDMSMYIFGRIKKSDMHSLLISKKSNYAKLYESSYPQHHNAFDVWRQKIGDISYSSEVADELSQADAVAIVYWVYRTFKNAEERVLFTKELFGYIKDLSNILHDICFSRGVFFNKRKVELHFLSSVSGLNKFLSGLNAAGKCLFYRGHADSNYLLQASIMRTPALRKSESKMYHELLINCPSDFEKCASHLEKLVEMQHYGLPTRLLDITRNPLVALYFACCSHPESFGELVLISVDNNLIKYPQSDTASILASLAVFPFEKQHEFLSSALDPSIGKAKFNQQVSRLIHEVRLEKPAFQAEIEKGDILNNYVVFALKNNSRIVKQDGAFILCGLQNNHHSLNEFRLSNKSKKIIVLVDKKAAILKQLDMFSINRASLFPEIECVSEYIVEKYSK